MRLHLVLALGLAAQASPTFAAENWQEYFFAEAGFSACFPGKPEISDRAYRTSQSPAGVIMERVYAFNEGGVIYSVSILDFTGLDADPDIAVAEVAEELAGLGRLDFDTPSYMNEMHGREIIVTSGDGTRYTDGVYYLYDHLYQIRVVYPATNSDPAGSSGINMFLTKFQFPNLY